MKSLPAAEAGSTSSLPVYLFTSLRILSGLLFLAPAVLFPWLVMGRFWEVFEGAAARLLVFAALSAAGSALYKVIFPGRSWAEAVLTAPLFYAFAYRLALFIPDVSTYPFSLGWSEASRYYYASLLFSEKIYGLSVPPSVLHPSRYLMQSAPFLFPDLPLWFHRAWQVFLWFATNLLAAALLARRLDLPSRQAAGLFIMGAFLFLFQGPVYYHLLVMPLLVFSFYDPRRPWRTAVVVVIAAAWGGISRINWIPVPGMLAAALYFLEVPQRERPAWKYLLPPVLWVAASSLVGLLSQKAYELLSGNPATHFGTSFTSDLLWYRLLPSRTFPMGVLPAAALASAAALLAILLVLAPRWRAYSPWRLLGLAGILGVLFAGGVVVSVKIGGGSNLHNLDAYLLLLLVTTSGICFGSFPGDHIPPSRLKAPQMAVLAGMTVLIPIYFAISAGGPLTTRDNLGAQDALATLRDRVGLAAQAGEVLFISERHLLTFHEIDGVELVPDYEKVFLMEMSMAGSRPYLDAFEDDLRGQRFALIVSEPLYIQYQGRTRQFGEENDAWVRSVSEPVLCYYDSVLALPEYGLELFEPAAEPSCP